MNFIKISKFKTFCLCFEINILKSLLKIKNKMKINYSVYEIYEIYEFFISFCQSLRNNLTLWRKGTKRTPHFAKYLFIFSAVFFNLYLVSSKKSFLTIFAFLQKTKTFSETLGNHCSLNYLDFSFIEPKQFFMIFIFFLLEIIDFEENEQKQRNKICTKPKTFKFGDNLFFICLKKKSIYFSLF